MEKKIEKAKKKIKEYKSFKKTIGEKISEFDKKSKSFKKNKSKKSKVKLYEKKVKSLDLRLKKIDKKVKNLKNKISGWESLLKEKKKIAPLEKEKPVPTNTFEKTDPNVTNSIKDHKTSSAIIETSSPVSKDITARNAISTIRSLTCIESIKKYIKGDSRITVKKAANSRINSLS